MGCLGCKDVYELGRVFRLAEAPNADGVDGRDPPMGLLRCRDTGVEGRDKLLSSDENYG